MSDYSDHDCGGPDVCSGCSSYRHGVYEDGSGDPEALRIALRAKRVDLFEKFEKAFTALFDIENAIGDRDDGFRHQVYAVRVELGCVRTSGLGKREMNDF
jgi:hypothetical protein